MAEGEQSAAGRLLKFTAEPRPGKPLLLFLSAIRHQSPLEKNAATTRFTASGLILIPQSAINRQFYDQWTSINTAVYDPRAIANWFLDRAARDDRTLTQMKLQKLVFIAHGFYLAIYDEDLIDEGVEAWQYGPVIRSLYREFAWFGNEAIIEKARVFDGTSMTKLEISVYDAMPDEKLEGVLDILEQVWNVYSKYTAVQLSRMTHQEGSPWQQAWNPTQRYIKIPRDTIKSYYETLVVDDG